jgi:hypothetical protein
MRGSVRNFRVLFAAISISTVACGGGGSGSSGGTQLPPPPSDFSLALSAASLTVPQGGTSSPVTVSITPLNSFSDSVQVTLSGLPAGISTNPSSPFTVTAAQPATLIIGATTSATAGQFNVTAVANSGTLFHSASLGLTIQVLALGNLPRSAYVEDDSVAAVDSPPGEPHRRHVVYDAAGQRFFVANRAMNRVEVVSPGSSRLVASVDAPGASSVDLSTDGSTLWVGTALEQILAVDTGALQAKARYPVTALTPIPGVVFNRPTELLALSEIAASASSIRRT